VLAQALVIAGLINGLFNFPPFVRAHTQRLSGRLLRREQGGDEAMDLPHLRIGGSTVAVHARGSDLLQLGSYKRINAVLNDAHLHGGREALARLGGKGRQVAAIGEHLLFAGKDSLGQPSQHMSPTRPSGLQHGSRDEATIQQHQHAGLERRQQAACQAQFGGEASGRR
jgi:hypothetical protein